MIERGGFLDSFSGFLVIGVYVFLVIVLWNFSWRFLRANESIAESIKNLAESIKNLAENSKKEP